MFNPRTPVSKLYADYVAAKPEYFDLSTGEYAYWQAMTCDSFDPSTGKDCGQVYVTETGLGECPECGASNDDGGPIYNYIYPISVERVGGVEEAALAVDGLSMCILEHDDRYYLALTACGMDMSWEICESYLRLGFLPPTHFANLPQFAGMKLDSTTRWVLAGMRRSLRLQTAWLKNDLRSIRHIRKSLNNKTA